MNLIIYTPILSNRLTYVSSFIFDKILANHFKTTNNQTTYEAFDGLKINYSHSPISDKEIWIKPHSILFDNQITNQTITVDRINEIPCFFLTNTAKGFPFDVFSCCFYMISRYEEYLDFKPDQHQRFSAQQSLAFQNHFLERPIIHEWLQLLIKAIQAIQPDFTPKETQYAFYPTYDIDIPWAFRYRGLRGWARAGLDLILGNWSLVKARFQSLKNIKTDPFYCFESLRSKHKEHNISPLIFWLIGNPSKHDVNPNYRTNAFRNLIQQTNQWSQTGLHPSYLSNKKTKLLKTEKKRLENVIQQSITKSRQHFLCLQFPQTYRQLIEAGIQEDYTMGFADKIGYRAGTSEPFYWFDLEKNEVTSLKIYPFVAMDVTLKQYEGFSPKEAQEKLLDLQAYCKKNSLSFRTLWHNSSFSDLHGWKGWAKVYWKLFE